MIFNVIPAKAGIAFYLNPIPDQVQDDSKIIWFKKAG